MGNFRLFQRARCQVIVKYTNCNLLEHESIRTRIRTLEAQIDGKSKNIEARENVTGSYKKDCTATYKKECNWTPCKACITHPTFQNQNKLLI